MDSEVTAKYLRAWREDKIRSGSMDKQSEITAQYLEEHSEARDEIMKAAYAFHMGHFRTNEFGHNFLSSQRWSKCSFCGRSREQVRYDELPPQCQDLPQMPSIQEVLKEEYEGTVRLSERAEHIVKKHFAERHVSGKELAFLKQTHGIKPEDTCNILDIDFLQFEEEFRAHEQKHSHLGKASFVPQVIK